MKYIWGSFFIVICFLFLKQDYTECSNAIPNSYKQEVVTDFTKNLTQNQPINRSCIIRIKGLNERQRDFKFKLNSIPLQFNDSYLIYFTFYFSKFNRNRLSEFQALNKPKIHILNSYWAI